MTTVYDPLYCDEPFLDDVPLPIEEEEDDAWYDSHSDTHILSFLY